MREYIIEENGVCKILGIIRKIFEILQTVHADAYAYTLIATFGGILPMSLTFE